jgi:4-hydroxybenzoate polyprenyltransferase
MWDRRSRDFLELTRLDRPVGIGLLLWPTLWALWIAADGIPAPGLLMIFCAGTVLMRSTGCMINDLLDRNIDPQVRRTRDRPLAARRLSPYQAMVAILVAAVIALLLALRLNAAAWQLALIGAALTLTYPLFKRFFPVPQLYLGICFGWGIPMAFAATLGSVPRVGWVLLLAAVLWAGVYDTFYAMADRSDDERIGVRSSAITFGDMDLLIIAAMQTMMLLALLLAGRSVNMHWPFHLGLCVGALCFAVQQWIARRRDPASCLRAFRANNYFGIVIFIGVVADFALRHSPE